MKKPLFFILYWIIPFIAFPQHSLESSLNMYRAGDVIVKQQVEYKDPGRSGENVLWDFSRLNTIDDEYELDYFTYNDTIIYGKEHRTRYGYSLQNDSLLYWGFKNHTTLVENSQPELLLRFPLTFDDECGNYFYAHGKYGNRLELDMMGTINTKLDAYGMMIMPAGDTLRHVVRTRSLKLMAEDTQPITPWYADKHAEPPYLSADSIGYRLETDSVLFITETFRWYAKGYRYPVFETVRSWEQHNNFPDYEFRATAFFYPPSEHYYLDDDEENLAILDEINEGNEGNTDPWADLTYNIFPNPVKSTPLEVELYLPRAVGNIKVQLRSTMGAIITEVNQGAYPVGTCSFTIDSYTMAVGNYILDIWLDEKLISEIIMKR